MTPAELDAIRARNAGYFDPALQAHLDRRTLLRYVDELRAELAALKEAAGKVRCWKCMGLGAHHSLVGGPSIPCPDCAELRKLLGR